MRVPFILLFASSALAAWLYALAGNQLSDPVLLALLSAIAAFVLVVLSALRTTGGAKAPIPESRPLPRRAPPGKPILVDGSNVMHWNGETPQIATLQEVIGRLKAQGYAPGVVFDANAGYKIGDRYMGDRPFAKALGLPKDSVLVVPKGTPADPYLLDTARRLGATIVTNDRYRDWVETYPEVAGPGLLRRGGYRDGHLWLETGS